MKSFLRYFRILHLEGS